MMGFVLTGLALLAGTNGVEAQADKTITIEVSFEAEDPANPLPQGEALLLVKAKKTCGKMRQPELAGETVVTGISMATGKPNITMSGTYACR
jgi:hypothetical protein